MRCKVVTLLHFQIIKQETVHSRKIRLSSARVLSSSFVIYGSNRSLLPRLSFWFVWMLLRWERLTLLIFHLQRTLSPSALNTHTPDSWLIAHRPCFTVSLTKITVTGMRIFSFLTEFSFFHVQNLRCFIYFQLVFGCFCPISHTVSVLPTIFSFFQESFFPCLQ